MINGHLVIDAVTHAFDGRASNMKWEYAQPTYDSYYQAHHDFMPEAYRMSREEYYGRMTPEGLASSLFLESETDAAAYHTVPMWGVFGDLSPLEVGAAIRERFPHRVMLYAGVSPLEGARAIEELERQVETYNTIGVKLYPYDIIKGEMIPLRFNDEQIAYPFFERCRELGVRCIAVHKAVPDIAAPIDIFRANDVDYAARDFPDLNFEVVHSGLAFLDEAKFQLAAFPNVYVNLEITSALLVAHPRLFCKIIGEFLLWGSHEQVFWGTGAASFHPAPLLERFSRLQIPDDMVEGEGYPELTDDIKRDILAGNFARLHGIDLAQLAAACADDEISMERTRGQVEPWAGVREPRGLVPDLASSR